ncbi:hypothetical protein ZIOFF_065729 [Zingiber officinale]|uniref:Uncharacterized protein n=1 Tax=Zingiber officinale TaxID=94328 RepID=A0A8J5F0I9_ZINOF|nr:hypothetical protein ZIOFF_065729 [Zingiber officinale]
MEVRERKTTSSQGIVRPSMWWLKPNSSFVSCNSRWNSGWARKEMGTMKRLRVSPTCTAKCPFGTSTTCSSCFRQRLEHLFRICFSDPT